MIVRPIRKGDLDALDKLASTSSIGIVNLPKNREILDQKIDQSIEAFSKKIFSPENEKYIFVLENLATGEIGGTCGLLSQTAMSHPIYFYRIEKILLKNEPKEIEILKPVAYKKEPSEISGLYLFPDFRKGGLGKLLSLSRFMFVAAFKERFKESFFAEIRGVIQDNYFCPFWEAVGRHFLELDYESLMKLAETGRGFIPDVLPKHPIYKQLLDKEVQSIIGTANEKSKPAQLMLQKQGFSFANEVDIFDGGPRITAKTSKIRTIKNSILATVHSIDNEYISTEKYLLSNEDINFRATIGCIKIVSRYAVSIHQDLAVALNIKVGQQIRYYLL